MRRPIVVIIGALIAGCAGESTAPLSSSATVRTGQVTLQRASPGTYVLTKLEGQSSAPFALFDHVCAGVHERMLMLGDTLILSADGTSHRGFAMTWELNGEPNPANYTGWSGTWEMFDATHWYYFGEGPSLAMHGSIKGVAVDGTYRVDSPSQLSSLESIGGSCPGVPSDGHGVVAVYKKQ